MSLKKDSLFCLLFIFTHSVNMKLKGTIIIKIEQYILELT